MAKKLTMKLIENEIKKFDEKKKVELPNGYFIHIYPNFSNEKIAELINETVTDPIQAKELGIDFDKISMTDWGVFNIIYKFTDLSIPSDLKLKIQAFNNLMRTEYWTDIIAAFPEESINKVKIALDNFSANFEALRQQEIERILESELIEQES
jgi:hypothetical protein